MQAFPQPSVATMDSSQDLAHVLYDVHQSLHNRKQPSAQRLGVAHILCGLTAIIAHVICVFADTIMWRVGHGIWGGHLAVIGGVLWIKYGTDDYIHTIKVALLSVFMFLTLEVGVCLIGLSITEILVLTCQDDMSFTKEGSAILYLLGCGLLILTGVCLCVAGSLSLVKCTRGPHVVQGSNPGMSYQNLAQAIDNPIIPLKKKMASLSVPCRVPEMVLLPCYFLREPNSQI